MTKLGNFKNKFDGKAEKFAADAAEYAAKTKAEAASKVFADKPYSEEYAGIYNISRIIALTANLVSLLTCLVCFNYFLALIIPAPAALGISAAITGALELLKNTLYKVNLKNYYRYQRRSLIAILLLVTLSLISLGSSALGASLIPAEARRISAEQAAAAPAPISIAAAIREQITELDKQQGLLLSRDAKSSTTKKLLKENAAAKAALLQQADTAADTDTAAAAAAAADRAAAAAAAENEANIMQTICIVLALFFELTYILATIYVYRYQFRIFIDTAAPEHENRAGERENRAGERENRTGDIATETPHGANTENIPARRPRAAPAAARKIGFYNGKPPALAAPPPPNSGLATCPTCQASFVKNHKKQVYCADSCRYAAQKANRKP